MGAGCKNSEDGCLKEIFKMKKKFSASWKASRQIRKQRKYTANAPRHIKGRLMSANLSKELRKKYSKRSIPVRKGDDVKVMTGKFKKKTGKISAVNKLKKKVAIEGMQKQKKDGTKINVWFDSSNLQVQKLELGDKKRIALLERKAGGKKEGKAIKEGAEKSKEVKKAEVRGERGKEGEKNAQ